METFHCLPRELLERASSADLAELMALRRVQAEEYAERERQREKAAGTS